MKSKNIEMLKWLKEQGCPWDARIALSEAIESKDLEVLTWVIENGGEFYYACAQAAGWTV